MTRKSLNRKKDYLKKPRAEILSAAGLLKYYIHFNTSFLPRLIKYKLLFSCI